MERKKGQAEDNDNKLKFVFLCRLLNSSYTGSNEAIHGMSNSMLYLDEKKSLVYWSPELKLGDELLFLCGNLWTV